MHNMINFNEIGKTRFDKLKMLQKDHVKSRK